MQISDSKKTQTKTNRLDRLLYATNLVLTIIICISIATYCWIVWKQGLSVGVGRDITGFHAQRLLGLDFPIYLASQFERLFTSLLMFVVPLLGVTSFFLWEHDYDVLWWSPWKPRSTRVRAHGSFILGFGAFACSYLLSDICAAVVPLFGDTSESQQFFAVTLIATVFFSVVSSIMLLSILVLINAFENSTYERKRKK